MEDEEKTWVDSELGSIPVPPATPVDRPSDEDLMLFFRSLLMTAISALVAQSIMSGEILLPEQARDHLSALMKGGALITGRADVVQRVSNWLAQLERAAQ